MNLMPAIFQLYPNVVIIRGDGDEAFDAQNNKVEIDLKKVQDYIDAHAYIEKRQAEYPPIGDQLDTLYHGGYDAWKATIKAVKDKYPKE